MNLAFSKIKLYSEIVFSKLPSSKILIFTEVNPREGSKYVDNSKKIGYLYDWLLPWQQSEKHSYG